MTAGTFLDSYKAVGLKTDVLGRVAASAATVGQGPQSGKAKDEQGTVV